MTDDMDIPDSFDGAVRLFPLPSVVLFPHVILPLHVFEPRYREMTAEALADDQLITMVLLKPGWESDYEGRPELHSVGCLGKIIACQTLEDGRHNLMLRGLTRVRLLRELLPTKLYRQARVELLNDLPGHDLAESQDHRLRLAQVAETWLTNAGFSEDQLEFLHKQDLGIGTLTDILAFALPLPMEMKQGLLEEVDVSRRFDRLLSHLSANEPAKQEPTAAATFPPDFSVN